MLVSALWHGFSPIYFIAFTIFAMIIEIERDIAKLKPLIN